MAQENAKLIELNGSKKEIEAMMSIADSAQEILQRDHNIAISLSAAIPTIAYVFMYAAAQYLEQNKSTEEDVSINLMNLFEMGVTYRETDDGDKQGNFVPYLNPGTIFKTVIKSDDETEDD